MLRLITLLHTQILLVKLVTGIQQWVTALLNCTLNTSQEKELCRKLSGIVAIVFGNV